MPLQREALIEFEVRRRLDLRVAIVLPGFGHLPQRQTLGRRHARGRRGLAQVREDLAHGRRLGDRKR